MESTSVKSTPLHPVIVGSLTAAVQEVPPIGAVLLAELEEQTVVVSSVVEVVEDSSSLLHEMMVRLIHNISKMYKSFFIFCEILKVKD